MDNAFGASSKFQSTLPREERRLAKVFFDWSASHFNPRSHERSDLYGIIYALSYYYFNPRSHERSDVDPTPDPDKPTISIHAPTRGAT